MAATNLIHEFPDEATWENLLGRNEWKDLLNPLHIDLRKLILHCGDLSDATYDAFIGDEDSKYHGSSRYGMKSFFKKVFLPDCASKYQVVAFLYTTPVDVPPTERGFSVGSKQFYHTNWMGYIAVSTDEETKTNGGRREVYVVWRGTGQMSELMKAFNVNLVSALPLMTPQPVNLIRGSDANLDGGAKVMEGWLNIYTSNNPRSDFVKVSAQTQVLTKIKELMEQYKDENISLIFTGHSLGGVLAALSAYNVVDTGAVPSHVQVAAFVFNCPMLGNTKLCDNIKGWQNLRILHVKNEKDLILGYHKIICPLYDYAHPGIVFAVDTFKSPYLKFSMNPLDLPSLAVLLHSLPALLHVGAGWNGNDKEFQLNFVQRSLALVNKYSGFLKDENGIPKSWFVQENKRMVLVENGDWVEKPPFQEEVEHF
ncbi:phospholipase A1-IIdelta-like [Cornus florida]|uniref:phospholipase A1-IIdelta-like n=1 Tax=Cornus florida TaxID=4283 RepID=UPI00289F54BD|nr:phospholipase A1-IIdelta-like [Cornus florida]